MIGTCTYVVAAGLDLESITITLRWTLGEEYEIVAAEALRGE